jgi:adenylate kinase
MTRIVIIAGLSGAGKTTLLKAAAGRHKVVTVGTLMADIGVEKGMVADRDKIKALPHRQVDELRGLAFRRVARTAGDILLDTHVTIEREPKLEPALPFDSVRRLGGVRSLIYVNARSQDVLARRAKDKAIRSRERQAPEDLDTQRAIDLSILGYLSTALNMPMYVINNSEGRIKEAAAELRRAIRESFSD